MNRLNIYQNITRKNRLWYPTASLTTIWQKQNDAQLKIYLFLIRRWSANLPTSVTDIADKFNYTEKDVLRALICTGSQDSFWH